MVKGFYKALGCWLLAASMLAVGCAASPQAGREVTPAQRPAQNGVESGTPAQSGQVLAGDAQKNIWAGESGDFLVAWSGDDILVTRPGEATRKIFSARQAAMTRLRGEYGGKGAGALPFQEYVYRVRALSLVGPFLSLEEVSVRSPQTYTVSRYRAIDLNGPERKLKLTDLFPAEEVLQALLADPFFKEALRDNPAPRTLAQLFELLPKDITQASDGAEREADKAWFPEDVLTQFAFDRLDGEWVVVKMGVPFIEGMRDEGVCPVELTLRIPSLLRDALARAEKRERGFLNKDAGATAGGRETSMTFGEEELKKILRR